MPKIYKCPKCGARMRKIKWYVTCDQCGQTLNITADGRIIEMGERGMQVREEEKSGHGAS